MNNTAMSFLNVPDLTVDEKRDIWIKRSEFTLNSLAEAAGVSASVLSRSMRNETMPTKQHAALLALGMPVNLLPRPEDKKTGPKPKPRISPGAVSHPVMAV